MQQLAQAALCHSRIKVTQEATLALEAERQKFVALELEVQRSWDVREQSFRRDFQNEYVEEPKSVVSKLEGIVTTINQEHVQEMRSEER